MKCVICDKNLKDHEAVRRHAITNEFLDICDSCLREIPGGLPTKSPAGVLSGGESFDSGGSDDSIDEDVDNVTNCYTLDDDT